MALSGRYDRPLGPAQAGNGPLDAAGRWSPGLFHPRKCASKLWIWGMLVYVNGAQVASKRGLGALIYEPAPVPVTIGSDWGFNASSARFTGFVDEVALYNRALTINEV